MVVPVMPQRGQRHTGGRGQFVQCWCPALTPACHLQADGGREDWGRAMPVAVTIYEKCGFAFIYIFLHLCLLRGSRDIYVRGHDLLVRSWLWYRLHSS